MTTEARQKPLLGQRDLRNIRDAATRIATISAVAPYLRRDLDRAELQLLALCGVVCEIIVGSLGEDREGDPVGDLVLKAQPIIPAAYKPKLVRGNGK